MTAKKETQSTKDAKAEGENLAAITNVEVKTAEVSNQIDEGPPTIRKAVADDAYARNHPTERPPAPTIKKWNVQCGDRSATVEAQNERDAWANACDSWKKWPSPRLPGIEIHQL